MVRRLNTLGLMIATLLMGACMQKTPEIPKEGDVVTWMQSSSLIIKTKLGQRREHIADSKMDPLIYEPEYERFIGQFPIDYEPERFPKFTEAERVAFEAEYAKKLHAVKSMHPIEFSLMLNEAKGKATDEGFYSPKALDVENQVKVKLGYFAKDGATTKELYEPFLRSQKSHFDKQSSDEYGLECYREQVSSRLWCFGQSSYNKVFGYSFTVMSKNTM